MKLSENFSINEFTYSQIANVNNIDNRPSVEVIENLKLLCENVLQPLRNHFGCPIIVTSGYRSVKLNKKVKGVPNSQHIFGQAADFIMPAQSLKVVFNWIKDNLLFDQLLFEQSASDTWIHVSFNKGKNRKQAIDNYRV